MISFLEGKIEHLGDKYAIINAGGIGYRVTLLPSLSISKTSPDVKGTVRLFIQSRLNVREGTFDLYGFEKQQELELFGLLTSVSGIGPKSAMGIMSSVAPADLRQAVVKDDANYLKKISGLGPKTAKRLVLELKNKIELLDIGDGVAVDIGQQGEALDALLALGYNQTQALDALKEVGKSDNLSTQVRAALKLLGKR